MFIVIDNHYHLLLDPYISLLFIVNLNPLNVARHIKCNFVLIPHRTDASPASVPPFFVVGYVP